MNPRADVAGPLHIPVPLRPISPTPKPPLLFSYNGSDKSLSIIPQPSFLPEALNSMRLMPEMAVAEGEAKSALRSPAQVVSVPSAAERATSSFRVSGVRAGDYTHHHRKTALPVHRLPDRHATQMKASLRCNESDVSATPWGEAASEADVLAFFGVQDVTADLATGVSPRASSTMAAAGDGTFWPAIDEAPSSICELSFSDSLFSADTDAWAGPWVGGPCGSHFIDVQAALTFQRDGARRQRKGIDGCQQRSAPLRPGPDGASSSFVASAFPRVV